MLSFKLECGIEHLSNTTVKVCSTFTDPFHPPELGHYSCIGNREPRAHKSFPGDTLCVPRIPWLRLSYGNHLSERYSGHVP